MDREKVIKGLKLCATGSECTGRDCPYWHNVLDDAIKGCDCTTELVRDALALLKEQESATEFILDDYQPTCKTCGFKPFVGYIPKIEWMKERGYKYCPRCGREVKWDE